MGTCLVCVYSPFLLFFFFFFVFLGGLTQSPSGVLTSSSAHLQEKVPARLTHTSLSGGQGPGVFVHSSISVYVCVCVEDVLCVLYSNYRATENRIVYSSSIRMQGDNLLTHPTHTHPFTHTLTHTHPTHTHPPTLTYADVVLHPVSTLTLITALGPRSRAAQLTRDMTRCVCVCVCVYHTSLGYAQAHRHFLEN